LSGLNPASHEVLIDTGYINQNVNGLDLLLQHVRVDQAILDKYCGQAQARHNQQLMEVLCTTQPWLDPELKEPGCE
jgi:hypothetical protein